MKRFIKPVIINKKIPIINNDYSEPKIINNTQFLELFNIYELEHINHLILELSINIDTSNIHKINIIKDLIIVYIINNFDILKNNYNYLLNVIYNYFNRVFFEEGRIIVTNFTNNIYKSDFTPIIKEHLSIYYLNNENYIINVEKLFINIKKKLQIFFI